MREARAEKQRQARAAARNAARAAQRQEARDAALAAQRKAAALAAAVAARDGAVLVAAPARRRDAAPPLESVALASDSEAAVSSVAQMVFLGAAGSALLLLAAAGAPARVLRGISRNLVWRRSDLAVAGLVLLSVGLLAVVVAAI